MGKGGGLALLWYNDVDLSISTYSARHIDVMIKNVDGILWRLLVFMVNLLTLIDIYCGIYYVIFPRNGRMHDFVLVTLMKYGQIARNLEVRCSLLRN